MMKESCHSETAQETLYSRQPPPISLFLQLLMPAPVPTPTMSPNLGTKGCTSLSDTLQGMGALWPLSLAAHTYDGDVF